MDNSLNTELIEALQGIHAELKRMNQNLATIATKPAVSAGPAAAPAGRTYSSGPRSSSSPSRGRAPGAGSYSRAPRFAEDGETAAPSYGGSSTSAGTRFGKKKPAAPGVKGKLPAKKGNGYPKKK